MPRRRNMGGPDMPRPGTPAARAMAADNVRTGMSNPWRYDPNERVPGAPAPRPVRLSNTSPRPRSGVIPVASLPVNFGWSRYEGRHPYKQEPLAPKLRYVAPVAEYPHKLGCSITGGYVYRGTAIPALAGRYLFGDYCSGRVWSMSLVGGKAAVRQEAVQVRGLTSFGVDTAGELYLASQLGWVYKLVP